MPPGHDQAMPHDQQCPHCKRFDNRGVSVDVVVLNPQASEVLLVERGIEPFKGYWATPGGFVEWDETVEQAACREMSEETGLRMRTEDLKLVGISSSPMRDPRQIINIVYLVYYDAAVHGMPEAGDDAAKTRWFGLADLPVPLAFDHDENVTRALALHSRVE